MYPINNLFPHQFDPNFSELRVEEQLLHELADQVKIADQQKASFIKKMLPLFEDVTLHNEARSLKAALGFLFANPSMGTEVLSQVANTIQNISLKNLSCSMGVDEKILHLWASVHFKIAESDKEAFVKYVRVFLSDITDISDKFSFAHILSESSPTVWERLIIDVSSSFHCPEVQELIVRLVAIEKEMPFDRKCEFIGWMHSFFKNSQLPVKDIYSIAKAISISYISPTNWQNVLKTMQQNDHQGLSTDELIVHLWAIDLKVAPDDRGAFALLVTCLFLNNPSMLEKYCIMQLVGKIPRDQQEHYVSEAVSLLATSEVSDKIGPIGALLTIDLAGKTSNKVNDIVNLGVANGAFSMLSHPGILKAFLCENTEEADRQMLEIWTQSYKGISGATAAFIGFFLPLCRNIKNVLEKYFLMQALSQLPPPFWGVAVNTFLSLPNQSMEVDEKIVYLYVGSVLSVLPKEEFIKAALPLIRTTSKLDEKYALTTTLTVTRSFTQENLARIIHNIKEINEIDDKILYIWTYERHLFASEDDRRLFVSLFSSVSSSLRNREEKRILWTALECIPLPKWNLALLKLLRDASDQRDLNENIAHLFATDFGIAENDRKAFIQVACHILPCALTVLEKRELAHALSLVDPSELTDALYDMQQMWTSFDERPSDKILAYLFARGFGLSQADRGIFVSHLLILFSKSLIFVTRKHEIALALSFVAPGDRANAVQQVSPYIYNMDQILVHLWTANRIVNKVERDLLANQLLVISHFFMDVSNKHKLFLAFSFLNAEQRTQAVGDLLSKLFMIDLGIDATILYIWTGALEITQEERRAFVDAALPLISKTADISEKYQLALALSYINDVNRAHLVQKALSEITEEMWIDEKLLLLWANRCEVTNISLKELLPFIMKTKSLPEKFTLFLFSRAALPVQNPDQFLAKVLPLLNQGKKLDDTLALLWAERFESEVDKANFSKLIKLFLPYSKGLFLKNTLCKAVTENPCLLTEDAIMSLSSLGVDQRKKYFNLAFFSFSWYLPKEKSSAFLQEMVSVFHLLCQKAPEDPHLIFFLLPSKLRTKEKLLRRENVLQDQKYRRRVLASLNDHLISGTLDPIMLRRMAFFAKELCTKWHIINDDHDVVQRGLQMAIAFERVGEKNPLSIYDKLKDYSRIPPSFKTPLCQVAGINTSFSLKKMQELGQAFQVTRDELPRKAKRKAWNTLRDNFKVKVESRRLARQELGRMGTTWDEIWRGCLSDPYLESLLKKREGAITLAQAQFSAIVNYLLEQESIVLRNEIFSKQEQALIAVARHIQACTGGKNEAIAKIYSRLEDPYRYHGKGFVTGDDQKDAAFVFIVDEVQKLLGDLFDLDAFMREVINVEQIEQVPHQSIYIKNLIGHLVGLNHQLVFDIHTSVLYDSLLQKTPRQVLEVFFTHMTPLVLVEALRKKSNDPSSRHLVKRHFSAFINELSDDAYTLADDDITIEYTQKGVLQILQKVGYLA